MVRTKFPVKSEKTYSEAYYRKVKRPGSMPVKWNDDRIRQAYILAFMFGATDEQIATAMNVHIHTINYWKRTKPEFREALQEGKREPNEQVELCMFQRACGYSHPDIDIRVVNGEIIETPIIKHYPPDVTAGIFWLKNRMREKWADVNKLTPLNVNITQMNITGFTREEKLVIEKMGMKQLMEHPNTDND